MFAHYARAVPVWFLAGLLALSAEAAEPAATLPRMVDLGAGKCIPCKKMVPILEAMKEDYAGVVDIVFLDVWKDPKAGKPYKIRVIPTQVFYDTAGQEVFRHEGFFSREDIEKVFQEKLGVKPLPPSSKKEEKSSTGWLLPGPRGADPDETGGTPLAPFGPGSGTPLLRVHAAYASVVCSWAMERWQRQGRTLPELLDSPGPAMAQVWTDRAKDPGEADLLMAARGLGWSSAIAFLGPADRTDDADDPEVDFGVRASLLEESL